MKTLILVSGQKRSGKGTIALAMKRHLVKAKIISFATPLKQILSTTFNMPAPMMDEYKNADFRLLHGIPPDAVIEGGDYRMQTYRETYQRIGDGIKSVYGRNTLAHIACKQIEQTFDICDYAIIDDLRLADEEYEYVKEFFSNSVSVAHGTKEVPFINIITVKVQRPELVSEDTHITENGMIGFEFQHTLINDGSIKELEIKAQGLLDGIK